MNEPREVPDCVIQSIADFAIRYERQGECPKHDGNRYLVDTTTMPCTCAVKMARFEDILKNLRWHFGHYSFTTHGMYVGVELDGYMHT